MASTSVQNTLQMYLDDSYSSDFEATVTAVFDTAVILDRTLFFPRGGGQLGDTGSLFSDQRAIEVVGTERRDGMICHITGDTHLQPGDSVRGRIDWPHRYQQMRTHTALHILCGLIFREYGATVTGCQMYPDRARMDFALSDLDAARADHIELLTNQAIRQGHAVRTSWLARKDALLIPDLIRTRVNLVSEEMDPIRIVEIVDIDLQADGGTHVRNTFEVGGVTITKTENKGASNKRIEISIPPLLD